MKISYAVVFAACTSSVNAFAPSSNAFVSRSTALNAQQSRQDFLGQVAATVVSGGMLSIGFPQSAMAAKYGSFGAGSPEVLDPKDADVDDEILASAPVQAALKKVQGYKETVASMSKTLETDPQANLKPVIIKELDFAGLRENLNVVNSAFEEDTQRGTDRLIRVIIQDITELETSNNLKDGVSRSERRLETMKGKLAKLDKAFGDYLAFAK